MNPRLYRPLFVFLVFSFLSLAGVQLKAEETPDLSIKLIDPVLTRIEHDLKYRPTLLENLDSYLEQLPRFSTWAKNCIDNSTGLLKDATEHVEALGYPSTTEPPEVTATRRKMVAEKEVLSRKLSSCKAIQVRSDDAIKKIGVFRKDNLQLQSFAQGRSIISAVQESILDLPNWLPALLGVLKSSQGIFALPLSQLLMLLSVILFSLAVSLMMRQRLSRWREKSLIRWQRMHLVQEDTGSRVVAALALTVRRFLVPATLSVSVALFLSYETRSVVPQPLITFVMDGLPILLLVYISNYFIFSALGKMGLRGGVDPKIDRSLRKRMDLLASVWFLGYLLYQTILANSLPEAVFFLVRAVLGVLLVLNVIWIIWLAKGIRRNSLNTSASVIATLALIAALVAELTGYRNISGFVLQGVVGTLVAYTLYQVLSGLIGRILDEVDEGKSPRQRELRHTIGVKDGEPVPGLIWLRLVATVVLWASVIAFLLQIWRVPGTEVKVLEAYILQGFTLGSIEIVPSKIIESLMVLSLLLIANGWFQRALENKWLSMTRLDRGARESIATIANYVGVAVAILIALVVAGMNFSKLAIVAGALSVGIGFGLQNIVNNFVSGLILLFERPIKTGDWIVAGSVEGVVKRISIRSTQIESFDHADIIVPNSELISGNLTNWLHKSWTGRIRMKMGVAYGSDTEKVRDILIGIARSQPQVILNNPRLHDPKVLFKSFGDSSLDFELRFFVRNIQDKFDIQSDVNYAIDKAFRENNIEIPFPQRVVYLKDEMADSRVDDPEEPRLDPQEPADS